MNNKTAIFIIIVLTLTFSCKNKEKTTPIETIEAVDTIKSKTTKTEKQLIIVPKTKSTITIDGKANETIWAKSQWQPLDQVWLGDSLSADDFSGRYKLTWNKDAVYLLAEIQDDTLIDRQEDPLKQWWDDDCLEVFIDEDNSGGEHQFNHNAFAYHIALDGNVVDMSTEQEGKLYNKHVTSKRTTDSNTSTWEVKIYLYGDSYDDTSNTNEPLKLIANRKVGFALAYCDNDHSETREHFIGSVAVKGDNKNRGWIDANIFGTLLLVDN